ncbi:MAG: polysaccharide deacetylase family protein, partial [Clostridia bacterium]|nr:polysaccharide deacetylase family protein [Clostridia bacterium]
MTNLFKNGKKAFSLVLALAIVAVSLFTGIGFSANALEANCANRKTIYWSGEETAITSGSGAQNDPYVIKTAGELAWLVKQSADVTEGKYFEIDQEIGTIVLQPQAYANAIIALADASAVKTYFKTNAANMKSWPTASSNQSSFCGFFDGNGATIYGLYQVSSGNAGLFSAVDAGAHFENLGLKNSYVTSNATNCNVGAIAASTNGDDCGANTTGTVCFDSCIVANNYIYNPSASYNSTGVVVGSSQDAVCIDNCLVYGNDATYGALGASTYAPTSQDPEWKSHPEDYKLLAFTFDDGPSSNMARLIELFALYEGTGTFFVRGISIKGDISYQYMQSAINAGWDLGNHGDKHLNAMTGGTGGGNATYDQIYADITNLTTKLESNLKTRDGEPYNVRFYRPPYIKTTENSFKICTEQDLAVIWLKRDSYDWSTSKSYADRYAIMESGITSWKDGDIILCHEVDSMSEDTYKILVDLLPDFYAAGYRFCSISELMQMRGITQNQLSGKLENKNGNSNMVTNALEVARNKVAPLFGGNASPNTEPKICNSVIFDTPVFDYVQPNDSECYENVITNVSFKKYLLSNGKIFSATEDQIKVVSTLDDEKLPSAFIKTDAMPELRSFHDDAIANGADGHGVACSCGLEDSNIESHSFVCDDEVAEWDSYYCEVCNYVCEHVSEEEGITEYEGDCVTAAGYEYNCPICGYHEEDFAEVAGHNFTFNEAEAGADCQSHGTIAHNYCDVCDKNYAADASETEPFENAITDLTGDFGDCIAVTDEEGNVIYYSDKECHWTICAVCGEIIETTDHNLDEGQCEICGAVKIVVAEVEVDATGVYTIIPADVADYDMATDVVVYD